MEESLQTRSELTYSVPRLQECITVFIAGPVASGKTNLTQKFVMHMERSLTFDVSASYLSDDYEHIWANPQALAQRLESNPYYFRIAYHPDSQHLYEEFAWCHAGIWSLELPRWFIIEEAHETCRVNSMHPAMNDILRLSRHNLLGVIATSQRIADVDKLLTSSARMTILFFTQEARDVDAARDRWGKDVADALCKLRPLMYNDATQECEQSPECLVITRLGFRVVALGSKIKTTNTEEEDLWQRQQQDEPPTLEHPSSEQDSGQQERRLPEHTSEAS